MIRQMAASLALVSFAVCLLAGLNAGNPAAPVLANALMAMGATFVVGLVVGAMAQKMLDENIAALTARKPAAPAPDAASEVVSGAAATKMKKAEIPERIPAAKGR